ncbi:hypothetical protein J6590_057557 [Homalodisca vitripennis]|nr:hypothetical protein J6590_057557 [Homalodisca vitripennis]
MPGAVTDYPTTSHIIAIVSSLAPHHFQQEVSINTVLGYAWCRYRLTHNQPHYRDCEQPRSASLPARVSINTVLGYAWCRYRLPHNQPHYRDCEQPRSASLPARVSINTVLGYAWCRYRLTHNQPHYRDCEQPRSASLPARVSINTVLGYAWCRYRLTHNQPHYRDCEQPRSASLPARVSINTVLGYAWCRYRLPHNQPHYRDFRKHCVNLSTSGSTLYSVWTTRDNNGQGRDIASVTDISVTVHNTVGSEVYYSALTAFRVFCVPSFRQYYSYYASQSAFKHRTKFAV